MTFKKQTASREQVKLMIGLMGPSGAGKTYSALQLAFGITNNWGKIVVADTENRSALYYAGADKTGPWSHIDFPPTMEGGYHPHNWVKLIEYVESDPNVEVLILDSISHEWEAKGGALDINNKLGGRFTDWAKVTPMHNAFIDKMRSSRLHIIATMRSKSDYAVETNEKGKSAPRKIGLKSIQRDGTDYEFGIIFDIDMKHFASSCKDRTGLFSEEKRGPFMISSAIGAELLAWAREGVKKGAVIFDTEKKEHMEAITKQAELGNVPDGCFDVVVTYMHGKEFTKQTFADAVVHAISSTKRTMTSSPSSAGDTAQL